MCVRHQDWCDFINETHEALVANGDINAYHAIPHPDLKNIPYYNGYERVEVIEKALQNVERDKSKIIDIGCHWGMTCWMLEEMGFKHVVGVEFGLSAFMIAEKIRIAGEMDY